MNSNERIWARLTSLARKAAEASAPMEPPPGFTTRVTALAMAARKRSSGIAWDWLALRGLGIACFVSILAIAIAWPLVRDAGQDDLAELADLLVVADASR